MRPDEAKFTINLSAFLETEEKEEEKKKKREGGFLTNLS